MSKAKEINSKIIQGIKEQRRMDIKMEFAKELIDLSKEFNFKKCKNNWEAHSLFEIFLNEIKQKAGL